MWQQYYHCFRNCKVYSFMEMTIQRSITVLIMMIAICSLNLSFVQSGSSAFTTLLVYSDLYFLCRSSTR
ncbi:hypothetical protein GQ42DRAFT_160319, partial [Ramicandelaber brevisporus]